MGDHRISSNDSRVFGPVASQFIYGRAVFAYWPVDHFGSLSQPPRRKKNEQDGGYTDTKFCIDLQFWRSKTGAYLTAARPARSRAAAAKLFSTPVSPAIKKFSPIPAMPGRLFA